MKEKEATPLSTVLKDLAEGSSLHGIPKITSSRQLPIKLLWCLLFIFTAGLLSYQIYNLFSTYYSYPIQTSVSLDFSPLRFPAITFCNMNPIKKAKVKLSKPIYDLAYPDLSKSTKPSKKRKRRKRFAPSPPASSDNYSGWSSSTDPGWSSSTDPGWSSSTDPGWSSSTDPGWSSSTDPGWSSSTDPGWSSSTDPGWSSSTYSYQAWSSAPYSYSAGGSFRHSSNIDSATSQTASTSPHSSSIDPYSQGSSNVPYPHGSSDGPSSYGYSYAPYSYGSSYTPYSSGPSNNPYSHSLSNNPYSYGPNSGPYLYGSNTDSYLYGSSSTSFSYNPYGSINAPDSNGPNNNPHSYGSSNNPYSYGSSNNLYSYGSSNSPYSYGSSNNPYSYGPTYNSYSYGSRNNPYSYSYSNIPYSYGSSNNPYSYGSSNNLYSYGSSNSRYSYGSSNNPYSYGPTYNPYSYGSSNNLYSYGSSNNPYSYGSSNNPYSYVSSNNPYSYGYSNNPYSYDSSNNPHSYGSSNNPYSYVSSNNPYSYDSSNNPYSYVSSNNPYSYGSSNNPYSYGYSNNPYSYGYSNNPYSYDSSNNPYSYGSSNTPYSYGYSNIPYSYGYSNNPYSYGYSNNPNSINSGTGNGGSGSGYSGSGSGFGYSGSGSSSVYDASASYGRYEAFANIDYLYDQLIAPKDQWEQRFHRMQVLYRNESAETRVNMGHQKTDFIMSASFAGAIQNISEFERSTTPEYGNCYTMSSTKYKATKSGPRSGIKLTLNVEKDEYVENLATGLGVRMVIHEPGTLPMPNEEGITLSAGYETNIGLRLVEVKRQGSPYGDCSDGDEFARQYGIKYSLTACMHICRIKNVVKTCNCLQSDAPYSIDLGLEYDRICGETPDQDKLCVIAADYDFDSGAVDCDCKSPCSEIVYEKTMSGRTWPTDAYLENVLMREICNNNDSSFVWKQTDCPLVGTSDFYPYYIQGNFLRVMIYFEDLNYEKIIQEPMYESVRFVSDLGGAMGLFMGASVLSFMEVFQLLLEIGLWLKYRATRMTSVSNHTVDLGLSDDIYTKRSISTPIAPPAYPDTPGLVTDSEKPAFTEV